MSELALHDSRDEAQHADYRAICFDLDGTLLPMDIDEFMSAYFKRIAAFVANYGVDPKTFMDALKLGTKAMATHTDDVTNCDAFWREFYNVYKDAPENIKDIANEFYDKDFCHIGDDFEPNPSVARTINALKQKGYPLLLTTMPMFPLRAVEHRLDWAGLNPSDFVRITNYSNSKSVKPLQTYFAENLAAMDRSDEPVGKHVLMVGNNTMEDFAFLDLGVDGYLVTDCLLDPIDFDISSIKHGSFAEFEQWASSLPDCKNPYTDIETGPISRKDMECALKVNATSSLDLERAQRNASLVADAVAGDHEEGAAKKLKGLS